MTSSVLRSASHINLSKHWLIFRTHSVKNLSAENLEKYGKGLEAIFINIDWDAKSQTLDDFRKLKLESTALMKKGIIFVWTPKEKLADIFRIME